MRKTLYGLAFLGASAVVSTAAVAATAASADVRPAVEAGNKQVVGHFGKGDAAGVAAL